MLIGIIMRMFMAYFASIRLRGIFAGSKSGGKYRFSTFLSPIVESEETSRESQGKPRIRKWLPKWVAFETRLVAVAAPDGC